MWSYAVAACPLNCPFSASQEAPYGHSDGNAGCAVTPVPAIVTDRFAGVNGPLPCL